MFFENFVRIIPVPVTLLNVQVSNFNKTHPWIQGKNNSFFLYNSLWSLSQVSSKRHPAPTSIPMTNVRTHLLIPAYF